MKEISALIKGLPRGPSLHLLWEDLVRKRAWQRPQRSRRAGTGLDVQPAGGGERAAAGPSRGASVLL